MRSWIFVIGAAAMGVASIFGFHFAIARANQRIEALAATPGASRVSLLLKKETGAPRYYARSLPSEPRCAACHPGANTAPLSPFACRPAVATPQILRGNTAPFLTASK